MSLLHGSAPVHSHGGVSLNPSDPTRLVCVRGWELFVPMLSAVATAPAGDPGCPQSAEHSRAACPHFRDPWHQLVSGRGSCYSRSLTPAGTSLRESTMTGPMFSNTIMPDSAKPRTPWLRSPPLLTLLGSGHLLSGRRQGPQQTLLAPEAAVSPWTVRPQLSGRVLARPHSQRRGGPSRPPARGCRAVSAWSLIGEFKPGTCSTQRGSRSRACP